MDPRLSIVVITRNRHAILEDCLNRLIAQSCPDREIIVVDSSSGGLTRQLVERYGEVRYVHLADGRNRMPEARNMGIGCARADVVAFVDDDCMVEGDWAAEILRAYTDPQIGGVGGRIVEAGARAWARGMPFASIDGEGNVFANFNAHPGCAVEVDHLPGGNMSFRTELLRELRGFDTGYTGSNIREETDMCVRVRRMGYKLIFNPKASVVHLAAAKDGIGRGSASFRYYFGRNETYFTFRNFPVKCACRHLVCTAGLLVRRLARSHGKDSAAVCCQLAGMLHGLAAWAAGTLRRRS